MSKDTESTFCEVGISRGDEIDSECELQLSLEEQVVRLQCLVDYLLKKNEHLRQTINDWI